MRLKKLLTGIAMCLFILPAMAVSLAEARPVQGGQEDQALVQVEAQYVCMVNNQRFDKKLIPIEVKDRTYYGCCDMCAGKLKNDPKSRVAKDPVSGKEVDKSKAVIGANSEGKVFYFESVANMKRFKPTSGQ